jgi:hypothetical protein
MLFTGLLIPINNRIYTGIESLGLPGKYISIFASRHCRVFDLLIVAQKKEQEFSINRRVSFQRISHGVFQSREYHLEQWLAFYDPDKKALTENKNGRILTYIPAKNKLLWGCHPYQKLKK